MVGYELEHGEVGSAEALLAELEVSPPGLAARVAAAREAAASEHARLAELAGLADVGAGARLRLLVLTPLVVGGVFGPLIDMWVESRPGGAASHTKNVVRLAIILGVAVALAPWLRKRVPATHANRAAAAAFVGGFCCALVLAAAAPMLGLDPMQSQVTVLLLAAYGAVILEFCGFHLRRQIAVCLLGFLVAAWRPELVYICLSVVNLFLVWVVYQQIRRREV